MSTDEKNCNENSKKFADDVGAISCKDKDTKNKLSGLYCLHEKILMIKFSDSNDGWGLSGRFIDDFISNVADKQEYYCVFISKQIEDNSNFKYAGWVFPRLEVKEKIKRGHWPKRNGSSRYAYDAKAPKDDSFKFTTKDEFDALLK